MVSALSNAASQSVAASPPDCWTSGVSERAGVSGYNQPKRTPGHPTKSHIVVAKDGDQVKTIRFGQQGVKGSPEGSARNKAFKARHAKNIAKGKMSAAFWADKIKW